MLLCARAIKFVWKVVALSAFLYDTVARTVKQREDRSRAAAAVEQCTLERFSRRLAVRSTSCVPTDTFDADQQRANEMTNEC